MSKQQMFRFVGLGCTHICVGKSAMFDYGNAANSYTKRFIPYPTPEQLDGFFASSSVCSIDDLTVYEIREAHANGQINYEDYETLISYKK